MEIQLRPYQQECVDTVNALPDGSRQIISIATGLGKTVTASRIDSRGGKTLILSHRDELVRQPEKYFTGRKFSVEKAAEYADRDSDVISASIQTLSKDKRLSSFQPDDFSLIIVDECHHAAAPTYRKVLDYFKPKLLIGLTATPKRGDKVRLSDVFDGIAFSRNLIWGIKNNYLSNIRSMVVKSTVNLSKVKMSAGDYNLKELAEKCEKSDMYDTCVKTYENYCLNKGKHTIIYCINVRACVIVKKTMLELFPEMNGRVEIITAETPQDERNDILNDFTNGKIECLINCMILTEGVDLPIVDSIIVCRPTANETLYTQIVGRGCRLYPGKEECTVYDVVATSGHKICTSLDLAGLDWNSISRRDKKLMTQLGINLLEMIEKVELSQKVANLAMELDVKEYDLLGEQIEAVEETIKDSYEEDHMNSVKEAVIDVQEGQRAQAFEEDNIENSHGLYLRIGQTSNRRYIIYATPDKFNVIYLSQPDILNKSVITVAKYNEFTGYSEVTYEPYDFDKALDIVRNYLEDQYPKTSFMWSSDKIRSWKNEKASEKQLGAISYRMRESNLINEYISMYEANFNKYEANQILDYISKYNDMKAKRQELADSIANKKSEAEKAAEESKGRKKRKGIVESAKSILVEVEQEDKPKYYFDQEFERYILRDCNKTTGFITRPITITVNDQYGQESAKPSYKQMELLKKRMTACKMANPELRFDISFREILDGDISALLISTLIDMFYKLSYKTDIVKVSFEANARIALESGHIKNGDRFTIVYTQKEKKPEPEANKEEE